ncbi:MAG: HEAT repeat domain-containing protein [Halobacteriota archaeon]
MPELIGLATIISGVVCGILGAYYQPLISDYLKRRELRYNLYRELVYFYEKASSYIKSIEEIDKAAYIDPRNSTVLQSLANPQIWRRDLVKKLAVLDDYITDLNQYLIKGNLYDTMQGDPQQVRIFYQLDDRAALFDAYAAFLKLKRVTGVDPRRAVPSCHLLTKDDTKKFVLLEDQLDVIKDGCKAFEQKEDTNELDPTFLRRIREWKPRGTFSIPSIPSGQIFQGKRWCEHCKTFVLPKARTKVESFFRYHAEKSFNYYTPWFSYLAPAFGVEAFRAVARRFALLLNFKRLIGMAEEQCIHCGADMLSNEHALDRALVDPLKEFGRKYQALYLGGDAAFTNQRYFSLVLNQNILQILDFSKPVPFAKTIPYGSIKNVVEIKTPATRTALGWKRDRSYIAISYTNQEEIEQKPAFLVEKDKTTDLHHAINCQIMQRQAATIKDQIDAIEKFCPLQQSADRKEAAIAKLGEILENSDQEVKIKALGCISTNIRDVDRTKEGINEVVGRIRHAVEIIIEDAVDPDQTDAPLHLAAVEAYGEIQRGAISEASETIVAKLGREMRQPNFFNRDFREAAAAALGKIGNENAIESLEVVAKDNNEEESIREEAVIALARIGPKSAEPLIAILRDKRNVSSLKVRKLAAFHLANIGDRTALSHLRNVALDDEDDALLRFVAQDSLDFINYKGIG